MIDERKAKQVIDMLGQGQSKAEIERQTGVSYPTICRIADGKWKPRKRRGPNKTVYEKCPNGHGMVTMPCLACEIEADERKRRGERKRIKCI